MMQEKCESQLSQVPEAGGEEKNTEDTILTYKPETFIQHKEEQIQTKQIINEMMREIDRCLLLLEK
ncbi:MAG TPA: hypothetical protein P5228_08335 [Bacteroidales bacterium]|nr:hypothetical protein [Bacteroidales bacterium]HRZ49389.1 hypothetical protein [Bacteroidales bacterium]